MNRNWLEWTILAASVGIVIAVVGYLVVMGFAETEPAAIRVQVQAARATDGPDGGWLVPVDVRNEGDETATSLVIEGSATVAGAEEQSQITVDVLAADSEVEIILGFSARPDDEIRVRVVGFEVP